MKAEKQSITKILMVGSSLNVKGGMTTVVESFLRHNFGDDIVLKYIPTHIEGVGKIQKTLYFLMRLIEICGQLVFGKVKIVHMHMSERGSFSRKYIVFRLAKFFNKQVITHTHGAEFKDFYEKSSSNLKVKIHKLLKGSNVVITLGESWNKIIKQIEPESNTFILRNSVQIPVNKNAINNERIKILFLAVLIKRKGILDLIEASKEIIKELEKNNKQVEFVIAGDGELAESAKALVVKLGLNSYFKFVGWVNNEQKHNLLRETDLFILPSYNEGLPMSILEAISYGIPVISTNVGSINEAVRNGENGFLLNAGDKDQLTEYTLKLLMGSDFYKMGARAREIAENFFNIDSYFETIKNLYLALNKSMISGEKNGTK
ncbi:glycosyltransferase [Ectobacillus panaciterrae]|uniref:glycosyltransferase n=1 Tax=Ectobacillus panaciterrae TaxID=363872 RepID=UPI00041C9CE7|nr:glycosyltransferase [Ectobacillus panaciterrae]